MGTGKIEVKNNTLTYDPALYERIKLDELAKLPLLKLEHEGRFSGPYGTAFNIETHPSYVRLQFETYDHSEDHKVIYHPQNKTWHIVDNIDINTLWDALPYDDPRFKSFEKAWYAHLIHMYINPGGKPDLGNTVSTFATSNLGLDCITKFGMVHGFKITNDFRHEDFSPEKAEATFEQIRVRFEQACKEYIEIQRKCDEYKAEMMALAIPENHYAVYVIRKVYPDYQPNLEIIASQHKTKKEAK